MISPITFVLLSLASSVVCTEDLETFRRTYEEVLFQTDYDPKNLTDELKIKGWSIGEENVYPYADCQKLSENAKSCFIIIEHFIVDGKDKNYVKIPMRYSCNSLFSPGTKNIDSLKMLSVKGNKVVFSYKSTDEDQSESLVFRVIDMTSCDYHEAKLNITASGDDWDPEVIQYVDGSLDVFLSQPNTCNGARCRYTFNSRGQRITGPVPHLPQNMSDKHIQSFAANVSGKYLSLISEPNVNEITVAFINGDKVTTEKIPLGQYNDIPKDFDGEYGHLSFCYVNAEQNPTYILCKQFGNENIKIVDTAITIPHRVRNLSVKNLEKGGLAVLVNTCVIACESNCCLIHELFIIRPSENITFNAKIIGFGIDYCFDKTSVELSYADDKKVCLSSGCEYGRWELSRRCYGIQ